MLERLFGRNPQEPREPEPVQLSEIPLPSLERKHYLLYLLSATATKGNLARDSRKRSTGLTYWHSSLKRSQIERLAVEIYADVLLDKTRTLAEIIVDSSKLSPAQMKMVEGDPVLNKVSLVYSQQEMEVSLDPIKIGDSYSFPELHAGSGPARPVLLDLYCLSTSSMFELRKKGQDEVSSISYSGADFTNVMRDTFAQNRSLQENDVVLKVGKYSQELVWRNQPPSVPTVV